MRPSSNRERWPDLDWERRGRVHALQKPMFDRTYRPAPTSRSTTGGERRRSTRPTLIRRHVLSLRLQKYRPTGGFAQFCLADGYPSVTWSVLGHDRAPKLGYAALQQACAPVIVLAERLAALLTAGDPLLLPIYAVSDRRIVISDMLTSLHLNWSQHGTAHHLDWQWQGDLPADSAIRVGQADTVVPAADGDLSLHLELHDADGQLVAEYRDAAPVRT